MPDEAESDEKKEVLDLIDEQKKPSRRERQRAKAAEQKTVQDQKDEALDIFDEDDQKKAAAIKEWYRAATKAHAQQGLRCWCGIHGAQRPTLMFTCPPLMTCWNIRR